jgi:hypothetical protein
MLSKIVIFFCRAERVEKSGNSVNEEEGEDNVNTIYEEESSISP